ncbi:MAG: hypothetical protein K1X46_11085, partial [Chitinophagaceae bacterium]|nr:hypothetical protein [Chitinophagaceae bacterium]
IFKNTNAQKIDSLLKEAEKLEFKLKEVDALNKYKEVLTIYGDNFKALIKASELSIAIGARLPALKDKKLYFESANSFANRAFSVDSSHADACYVIALVNSNYILIEKENKALGAYINTTKQFAEKAIQLNNKHAKAHFILGNWYLEMVNLSGLKKTAVKLFYGTLPKYSLEDAIKNLELCRLYDQYYMINYLQLAKAYIQDNNPTKAIEVLQKLKKLPLRTADDAAIKEEGVSLLSSLQ